MFAFKRPLQLVLAAFFIALSCRATPYPSQQTFALNGLPLGLNLLQTSIVELSGLLEDGNLTSVQLVEAYLDNIERDNIAGLGLRAVIESAPRDSVLAIAQTLDSERSEGNIRGPLHGIPILVKDNIATDSELGMGTSGGSLALKSSVVPRDAYVVSKLREAGAIIIAKTNLNEFAGWKGYLNAFHPFFHGPTNGWSAVGGQGSSAYVEGGFEAGGDPMGSSSGSAVGVSAGWAAGSLGTDTMGSVLGPASRAALFAIRTTMGLLSRAGAIPVSLDHDQIGPIGFTTLDVAIMLQAMLGTDERDPIITNYTRAALHPPSLSDLHIGIPTKHLLESSVLDIPKTCPSTTASTFNTTVAKLSSLGVDFTWDTDFDMEAEDVIGFRDSFIDKVNIEFAEDIQTYLDELEESEVRSLLDIVNYNDRHADIELPPAECCQERLLDALLSPSRHSPAHIRSSLSTHHYATTLSFAHVFTTYPSLDVLVLPFELGMPAMWVGGAGYPAGVVPMGACENGLPFGLMVVGRKWEDDKVLGVMAAFEKVLPKRLTPKPLRAP
ncbi:hypothetical protein IAT38_007570 [Cryptococcus sp. DSM 104549]